MIENEWYNEFGNEGHENRTVHLTLEDASSALVILADSFGIELEEGQHSFDAESSDDDSSDVYFINSYPVEG